MTNVAFNGLGVMGSGMAMRLVQAGFQVTVYNRTPKRAEELKRAGARVAASPAEAAQNAEAVVTMVADDRASRVVWTGPEGALSSVPQGALLIDCGTVSPGWVRELAALAEARGCSFLDAPVTGSKPQAHSGELLFLVGGQAGVLDRARPLLEPMSRGILHLGSHGAGATMKLINNFLCGVQAAGLAEALAWIEKSRLDSAAALSVLTGGAPGSPLVKALAGRMCSRAYETNFRLDLMSKDLTYACDEARRAGLDLLTGDAALQRFDLAVGDGLGERDLSAVIEPLRGNGRNS